MKLIYDIRVLRIQNTKALSIENISATLFQFFIRSNMKLLSAFVGLLFRTAWFCMMVKCDDVTVTLRTQSHTHVGSGLSVKLIKID